MYILRPKDSVDFLHWGDLGLEKFSGYVKAVTVERVAEGLFRIDAGGLVSLVTFENLDDETKDYWRNLADDFLDFVTDSFEDG